jgi:uncharacterized caspase-like protein
MKAGPSLLLVSLIASLSAIASSCKPAEPMATRYALVYGVNSYPNLAWDNQLTYPDADADSMAALFRSSGYTDVKVGKDAQATKALILGDLNQAASTFPGLDSSSTFVFYFSGHGIASSTGLGEDTAIAPSDVVLSLIPATAISAMELENALASLPTHNVIVILDTCFSGGFVSPGPAMDTAPQSYGPAAGGTSPFWLSAAMGNFGALLAATAKDAGRPAPIVISAAGSQELSYEYGLPYAHGIFTFYLLEAAAKGDLSGDGRISTTEAYAYVAQRMARDWNAQTSSGYQDYYPHLSGSPRALVLFTK